MSISYMHLYSCGCLVGYDSHDSPTNFKFFKYICSGQKFWNFLKIICSQKILDFLNYI